MVYISFHTVKMFGLSEIEVFLSSVLWKSVNMFSWSKYLIVVYKHSITLITTTTLITTITLITTTTLITSIEYYSVGFLFGLWN